VIGGINAKNYGTDGGDTWVIGGRLVIEDGATVEGLEGGGTYTLPAAAADKLGGVKLASAQTALENTAELSDVITAFNALLTALKASGVVASS
jgi:hypothetical protein